MLAASVSVLIAAYVLFFQPESEPTAKPAASQSASPRSTTPAPSATGRAPTNSPAPTSAPSPTPGTAASPTSVPVLACAQAKLEVKAGSEKPSYAVTAQPVLYLQVTNVGSVPCSADLADPQVELIVYNGASRVWGSHDCAITPGTSVQTLAPKSPVVLTITWSGMSSRPECAGVRQHVQRGNYTLHAKLHGVEGATSEFTLT